jgi:putative transposase
MIKSIKVRLNPNNKQLTKLFQYASCARFAYNWAIAREQENYHQGNKFLTDNELRKEFTQLKKLPEYKWLNEVSSNVTKQAIKDACNTYKRFFKGQCKYPKFKSKKYSTPAFYQDNCKIQFTDTHVKVEGFSMSKRRNKQKLNWIRLCEKGRIPTNCRYMNPRFTYDGLYWYVSVGFEVDITNTLASNEGIGIDLGIKDLAVCSNGSTYKNINKIQKVKKLENENAGYSVPYQEDMRRIRKE